MTSNQGLEPQAAWATRWAEQKTGWNLGQSHPMLTRLIELGRNCGGLKNHGRIFVPGCGHGHEAAALARLGYDVLASDFVEQALDTGRKLYGDLSRISWRQADVLRVEEDEQSSFAAVVDRAMLCALQPENRPSYVASCAQRLNDGEGLFMGILFAEVLVEQGPPFAISEAELWDLMSPYFNLVHMEKCAVSALAPTAIRAEYLSIWRKLPASSSN